MSGLQSEMGYLSADDEDLEPNSSAFVKKDVNLRGSENDSAWMPRRKFKDMSDLSSILPKHKKKMKRKHPKPLVFKRPEPTLVDGSSPYAEYLPQRFRQYNPETHDYERGPQATMGNQGFNVNVEELMSANFGRHKSPSRHELSGRKYSAASSQKKGLNFYSHI